jgi:hypothetical protein
VTSAIGDRQWIWRLEIENRQPSTYGTVADRLPIADYLLPVHWQFQIADVTLPDCPIPTSPIDRATYR